MKKPSRDLWIKGGAIIIIALQLLWVHFYIPNFYSTLLRLTLDGDVDGLTQYLSSFGYGAIVISIFMIVLSNVTGLPSIPFLTVNGVIFGLIPGIIISWVGEVIGIEGGFVIMRTILRDKARKVIASSKMGDKLENYTTVKNMAICRAIPYSPNVVFTAMAAVSTMSFRNHTLATFIGKVPSVIFEVWLGHDLIRFSEHGGRFLIIVTVLGTLYYFYHHYRKNRG